jgi:hypothetical protein
MNIVFIIGCIEPGKDGVGDYTRSLSASLMKKGHEVEIIATHDKFAFEEIGEYQEQGGMMVACKRIPYILSDAKRISFISRELSVKCPDYVSLQYVPYSFHNRGLPLRCMLLLVKSLSGHKVNVMFHELWIGIGKYDSCKNKIIGYFQKKLIIKMVKILNEPIITTSNEVYKHLLKSIKVESQVLSLFSNIDRVDKDKVFPLDSKLSIVINKYSNSNYMVLGVFGSLHPMFDLNIEILSVLEMARQSNKKLVMIVFGKSSRASINRINIFELQHKGSIDVVRLGELTSSDVSLTLGMLNLAIVGKPKSLLGKSGIFAAMRLHDIPILAASDPNVIHFDEIAEEEFINFLQQPTSSWDVNTVACQFVEILSTQ